MILGKTNTLTISKESPFGLFLQDENNNEVLLPNAYVTTEMQIGERIEVFLYHDSEDRLVATTQKPLAELDEFGFFEVVDYTHFGAFVDWGLPKHLLVPKQFQKEPFRIGEKKFLRVVYDEKTHRLVATQRFAKYLNNNPKGYFPNKEVKALIVRKTPLGFTCIVDNNYEGLVYKNELFSPVEVGKTYTMYVKKRRHDGKLDISLRKTGAKGSKETQNKVLELLKLHGGSLPFTTKSPADSISEFFGMSKKEFKLILNTLIKKGVVIQKEDTISLNT